jgi:serine/threonine protein phosphatase PrpC
MPCPTCGEPTSPGANFCEACGADLTELGSVAGVGAVPGVGAGAGPVATGRPPAAAAAEVPPGPPCVACGEPCVGADGYCGSCGHRQPGPRDHLEVQDGVVVAVTDKGLRHHHNEDAFAIATLPGGGAVLVVCDGVSTTPGSEVASQAAADAARELLMAQLTASPPARPDEALVAATAAAQVAAAATPMPEVAPSHPHAGGGPPSSTFVAAVARPLDGEIEIDVAWVGDSRAYWVAGDEAVCLIDDHELGGSLIRWLGADTMDATPELTHLSAAGPGRLLVVSDGMWRYADPATALAELVGRLEADHKTSQDLAVALVEHALAGGGHDNITVTIWDSADTPSPTPAPTPEPVTSDRRSDE